MYYLFTIIITYLFITDLTSTKAAPVSRIKTPAMFTDNLRVSQIGLPCTSREGAKKTGAFFYRGDANWLWAEGGAYLTGRSLMELEKVLLPTAWALRLAEAARVKLGERWRVSRRVGDGLDTRTS